jgi:mono/diheme cytochrome c family protein
MRCLSFTAFAIALALPIGISAQSAPKGTNVSRNYYTDAQAGRGKQQYSQFCAQCHMANLKGAGTAPALVGDDFLHDYYSVNDLYIKVSVTMPDDNVHGLSNDAYLNIISYLLKANGLPAGTEPLKGDITTMKRMALMPRKPAVDASGSPDGFYTVAQAERGKGYFRGNCGMCHAADQSQPDKRDLIAPPGRGFVAGPVHIQINLESDESFARWQPFQ